MLSFIIENISYQSYKSTVDSEIDAVNIECDFKLFFNDKIILNEAGWNIAEFLIQLIKWQKKDMKTNFIYYCIDTDDEEIFIFEKKRMGFEFHSSWSENQISEILQKEEINNFINKLKEETIILAQDQLIPRISRDLFKYLNKS